MQFNCNCDSKVLVSEGCQCGGGRAEIERAHSPAPTRQPEGFVWERITIQTSLYMGDLLRIDPEYPKPPVYFTIKDIGEASVTMFSMTEPHYSTEVQISKLIREPWYRYQLTSSHEGNNNADASDINACNYSGPIFFSSP